MFSVWKTRILLWKKQAINLLFWLCFPILVTVSIISIIENIQEDTKIPVGIVMEEDTQFAKHLHEQIRQSSLLRIIDVTRVEAKQMVLSQKIDSAFILTDGLEEDIKKGNRNWIIRSFSTDLSFGYVPAKEMIISYVQEASGKAKAAETVQKLSEGSAKKWTWDEIVMKTNDIQSREHLLYTDFTFHTKNRIVQKNSIWDPWEIWAAFTLLSTLFLFDWVIKEQKNMLTLRLPFMRISMRNYLFFNLCLYTIVIFILDLFAASLFQFFTFETITLTLAYQLLMFRVVLNLGAFSIALFFTNSYIYYCFSILITLVVISTSGILISSDEIALTKFHPFYPLLELDGINYWIFPQLLFMTLWWMKGGKMKRASRTVLK